jgi:hypothetical protein
MEEGKTSRWVLVENSTTKISRKTKKKLGGRCPGGCITGPRNMKLEETSCECKRMEAPFEESQGPRGALALYMTLNTLRLGYTTKELMMYSEIIPVYSSYKYFSSFPGSPLTHL